MTGREREILIEQVVGAWRPRDPDGGVRGHPAWHDLSEADRREAFEETARQRQLEGALDPDGVTSTTRAVLARIRGR